MRMCTSDVNLLERWQWNPRQNLTFAGDLTSDGYISTQQLAQAWKQKFPGLLTDNLHDYMVSIIIVSLPLLLFSFFYVYLLRIRSTIRKQARIQNLF